MFACELARKPRPLISATKTHKEIAMDRILNMIINQVMRIFVRKGIDVAAKGAGKALDKGRTALKARKDDPQRLSDQRDES